MAQRTISLTRLYDPATDQDHIFQTEHVFDKNRNKLLSEVLQDTFTKAQAQAEIASQIATARQALLDGDIATLQSNLSTLSTSFNTFMTGEPDQNETVDRLKELLVEINANKDSIAAITSGYVKQENVVNNLTTTAEGKVLDGRQGKVLKDLIDTLQSQCDTFEAKFTETANGDLVYHGKDLSETGIAYGATAAAATDFHGKLKVIVESYSYDDGNA